MSRIRRTLGALALCAACTPAPVAPPPTAPPADVLPLRSPVPSAAILWTSPPTTPPTPTVPPAPAPTAPPTPPPTPAATRSPVPPSPTARPTPTPSPSPTLDPLRWTRYSTPVGTAIVVPAAWMVLGPAPALGISFTASPDALLRTLEDQPVLVSGSAFRGDAPFTDVKAFADLYQRTRPGMAVAVREAGTHPSGPVVFLKHNLRYGDGPILRQLDALFVRDGVGRILGMRAPVDRWQRYLPTFQQIFLRSVP